MNFQNEKLNRKLSIFYHPLFQDFISTWWQIFSPDKANINMITFVEVNLRIQKAIIPAYDFSSALNSALTDWFKELDDLAIKNNKKSQIQRLQPIKPNLNHIVNSLDSLPFITSASNEKYLNFFKTNKGHIAMKYFETQLSQLGFSKFLFDLCLSWCENLDIELFLFFLTGLFLQMTEGSSINKSSLLRTDYIAPLSGTFLNQMKIFKTHYERYKKQDLLTFQSWYEWNYLPSRLREITKKIMDTLRPLYGIMDSARLDDLGDLFEKMIQKRNLDLMTTAEGFFNQLKFFEQLSFDDSNDKYKFGNISSLGPGFGISEAGNNSNNTSSTPDQIISNDMVDIIGEIEKNVGSKHAKKLKKVCLPIFGRSLTKQQQQQGISNGSDIHTISNHSLFMDSILANDGNLDLNGEYSGLYPIWEKGELSDCTSYSTLNHQDEKGYGGGGGGGDDYGNGGSMKKLEEDMLGSLNLMKGYSEIDKRRLIDDDGVNSDGEVIELVGDRGYYQAAKEISLVEARQRHQSMSIPVQGDNTENSISSQLFNRDNSHLFIDDDSEISKIEGEEKGMNENLEDYLDNAKDISYISDNSGGLDASLKRQRFSKGRPSFIKKYFEQVNVSLRDRSASSASNKKINTSGFSHHYMRNSHSRDDKLEYNVKSEGSMIKDKKLNSKYSLPYYNRKVIWTSSAKQNSGNLNQKVDNSNSQNKLNHEGLAIIVKKDSRDLDILESKKLTMTAGMSQFQSEGILPSEENKILRMKGEDANQTRFDFSPYEQLFPDGLGHFEIHKVKTEKDYILKIDEIQKAYNKQFMSEYLKSYTGKTEYNSTRHEMGGLISDKDREDFLKKIESLWQKKLNRLQKKKKNTSLMPRVLKTLDKPKANKAFLSKENRSLFKEAILGSTE